MEVFKELILELSGHLCICRYRESSEEVRFDNLLIIPYIREGYIKELKNEQYSAEDIQVLVRPMMVWIENESWNVQYSLGQTRPTKSFNNKKDVILFLKSQVEEYWAQHCSEFLQNA